ncbi:MAG: alpha/beta fold hydrolase [Pseudomonadota bacterium]
MMFSQTIEDIRALEAGADMLRTPCGAGEMVWRGWGAGPCVILLHGGSGSWTHWARTVPDLARDYSVWAADLPGLGESAMPDDPPTPQTSAAAVAAGVREILKAGDTADLVGFSFGAHVGTFAASELGDRLRSFTIVGTSALGLDRPMLDAFPKERASMDMSARREIHRRVLEILMISDPDRIDETAVTIQQENVEKARFRSRKFAATSNVRDSLADVHVPLRAVWGEADVIARPSLSACLDALRLHHQELVAEIIPDAGHWVMWEQADRFNEVLRRVLAVRDVA